MDTNTLYIDSITLEPYAEEGKARSEINYLFWELEP